MDSIRMTRPDDAHLHLRDGAALASTVPATARVFARAVVMPNLVPPVTTVAEALEYRSRVRAHVPDGVSFEPLMTIYLTDGTTADEVRRAADEAGVVGAKLYPAGATTNSDAGVSGVRALDPVFEAMQESGLPLQVHGEVTDPDVDVFDREERFLESELAPLCDRFPELKVVFEHITTAAAARFVESARAGIAATITPQHLLMNRNDLFRGGLRPHHYCLPVLKRREHQAELLRVVASGDARFFLGTDSAPHAKGDKESSCGCAGCYSAPAALPLYAKVFDELGALDHLEAFAAHHAADFYRLPRNGETVTLRRDPWVVPEVLELGAGREIVPLLAGERLDWTVED